MIEIGVEFLGAAAGSLYNIIYIIYIYYIYNIYILYIYIYIICVPTYNSNNEFIL